MKTEYQKQEQERRLQLVQSALSLLKKGGIKHISYELEVPTITLWRYVDAYRQGGAEALCPKIKHKPRPAGVGKRWLSQIQDGAQWLSDDLRRISSADAHFFQKNIVLSVKHWPVEIRNMFKTAIKTIEKNEKRLSISRDESTT